MKIVDKYLISQFLKTFLLCVFSAVSLFLIIELFDKSRVFIKEGASYGDIFEYLFYRMPPVIYLMIPIASLISTLTVLGRLGQLSELTALRACGFSVLRISVPFLVFGLILSALMALMSEVVVPYAARRVDEIYNFQIRKKNLVGTYDKSHFWYRDGDRFFSVDHYDSKHHSLSGAFQIDITKTFGLDRVTSARTAFWMSPNAGWNMNEVVETVFDSDGSVEEVKFRNTPLVIDKSPEDFYNREQNPDAMSYKELERFAATLAKEGVSITGYLTSLASKISFPFIAFIVVLVGIPFGITHARANTMTRNFIIGVAIGFSYYFVHAVCVALGGAELIPVTLSAWIANIMFICVGGFLIFGAEKV